MNEEQISRYLLYILGLYVLKIIGDLVGKFAQRRFFDGPDVAEKSAASKLDKVASDIGEMKGDLKTLNMTLEGQKATVQEVRSRVEGISLDHGRRLAAAEAQIIRFDERMNLLGLVGDVVRQVIREEKERDHV